MIRRRPLALVYDEIYSRRLNTPHLVAIDAATSGNRSLAAKCCATIFSESSLDRLRKVVMSHSAPLRILDVGCGLGALARWFVEQRDCSVVAIDASRNAIIQARERNGHPKIKFLKADYEGVNNRLGCFDLIVSLDALYLAQAPKQWLAKSRALLQPGSTLMFTFYASANGVAGANHSKKEWVSWLAQSALEVVSFNNITRFWRQQMRERHGTRLSQAAKILSSDGPIARSDLQVSQSLLQNSESQGDLLSSISRYEVYARRRW